MISVRTKDGAPPGATSSLTCLSYKLQVPWAKQTRQEDSKVSPDRWWEWESNEKVPISCHKLGEMNKGRGTEQEAAEQGGKQDRISLGNSGVELTPDAEKAVSEENASTMECISKPQSLWSVSA